MQEMNEDWASLRSDNLYIIIRYTLIFLSALLFLASCSTSKSTVGTHDYTKNKSRYSLANKSTPYPAKSTTTAPKVAKSELNKSGLTPVKKSIEVKRSTSKSKIAVSKPKTSATKEEFSGSKAKTTDTRSAMVTYAMTLIGIGYRYGGRDETGFDCSGFTCHVLKKFELPLPRTSSSQYIGGQRINWQKAQIGDLIFFGDGGHVSHVGIVTKNTGHEIYVIHSTSSEGIRVDEVKHNSYWAPKIIGAANYVDQPRSRGSNNSQ